MKKKKKKLLFIWLGIILIIIIGFLIALYFNFKNKIINSPIEVTKKYLDSYNKLDRNVISNIKYDFKDELNENQKNNYTKAIRRQYEKLGYSVIREEIDESKASIKVEVNVYDYNTCWNNASDFINLYSYRFTSDEKKTDYKISQMSKCKEKITHNIIFSFNKKDKKWIMDELKSDDIRKINGTY